jgi:hypothetical protein
MSEATRVSNQLGWLLARFRVGVALIDEDIAKQGSGEALMKRSNLTEISDLLARSDNRMQAELNMRGSVQRANLAELVLRASSLRASLSGRHRRQLALVVHHGGTRNAIRRCRSYIHSPRAGTTVDDLYKQMTDRILVMKYRKQKYGTQYRSNAEGANLGPFTNIVD